MIPFKHPYHGNCSFIEIPTECIECHFTISPIYQSHVLDRNSVNTIYAVLSCPNPDCCVVFTCETRQQISPTNEFIFVRHVTGTPAPVKFSETLSAISPDFVEIYTEASEAEQNNLLTICGVGYRKALEFLIKDFLISQAPEKKDEIIKSLLGKCINDFVTDLKLKQAAKRAVWLGNDETHYDRKWVEKDLKDLKLLISLTCHWVEMECLNKQILEDMPEAK